MAIVKSKPFRPTKQRPEHAADPYSTALRLHAPVQIDPYQFPNGGLNDVDDDAGDGINTPAPSLGQRGTSYLTPQRDNRLVAAGYPYDQLGDVVPDQLGDVGDTGIALVDDVHRQIDEAAYYAKLTAGFAVAGGVFSALAVYFLWPRRR